MAENSPGRAVGQEVTLEPVDFKLEEVPQELVHAKENGYFDDLKNFLTGGVHSVLKERGVAMPEWMDKAASFLQGDAATAVGMAAPLKGGPSHIWGKRSVEQGKNPADKGSISFTEGEQSHKLKELLSSGVGPREAARQLDMTPGQVAGAINRMRSRGDNIQSPNPPLSRGRASEATPRNEPSDPSIPSQRTPFSTNDKEIDRLLERNPGASIFDIKRFSDDPAINQQMEDTFRRIGDNGPSLDYGKMPFSQNLEDRRGKAMNMGDLVGATTGHEAPARTDVVSPKLSLDLGINWIGWPPRSRSYNGR